MAWRKYEFCLSAAGTEEEVYLVQSFSVTSDGNRSTDEAKHGLNEQMLQNPCRSIGSQEVVKLEPHFRETCCRDVQSDLSHT